MPNFLSSLLGGKRGNAVNPDCKANDPDNCRICHTGRYANVGGASKEDALTPAERELARIKAGQAKGNIGRNPSSFEEEDFLLGHGDDLPPPEFDYWFAEDYLHGNHKPVARQSRFEYAPPPPPKIRSISEIEDEMKKVASQREIDAVRMLGNYVSPTTGDEVPTRISPLTGLPISRECNSMIDALMLGVHLTNAEIESCPEWKDAQKHYDDYADDRWRKKLPMNTWSDVSKPAEAKRKEVYDLMSSRTIDHRLNPALKEGESYEVEKGFRFDIVSGLPASGKNSVFADRLSTVHRARLLDADIVKTLLPGYEGGLGSNIVHDESTFINKDLLDDTFTKKDDPKHGDNIVYPTLGGNPSKLVDFIEAAHDAGYKVHLHFNEIDVEKAKGRMLYRMIHTGRFLPLRLFETTGNTVSAYKFAKDYADTAEWVRSGAGKGVEPVDVESVTNAKPKRRPKYVPPKDPPKSYSGYGYSGFGYGSYGWNSRYRKEAPAKKSAAAPEPNKDQGSTAGMSVDQILAAFAAMKK